MTNIHDVDATDLIQAAAIELSKMPEMAPPVWATFVKTGVSKERPPSQNDWWYVRAASVLRTVYLKGPTGVSKLRTKYGGRKNRGVAPDRTVKGAGNIIRKILQKLEILDFVKQGKVGAHKGRMITPKGISFLAKISSGIAKTAVKPAIKKEVKPAKESAVKAPKKEVKPAEVKKAEKSEEKPQKKEAKPTEAKAETKPIEETKEKQEMPAVEEKAPEPVEAKEEAKPVEEMKKTEQEPAVEPKAPEPAEVKEEAKEEEN